MSNQAERVTSRLKDDQHSARIIVNKEQFLEIPINEGNNSGTSGIFESSWNSTYNSEGYCDRCSERCSECGESRTARSITIPDDDNPPPYSALIPQDHVTWFYEFPNNRNTTTLEQFQQRLTSSNVETCPNRTRPHSPDAISLTAFGSSKENPSGIHPQSPENLRIAKVANLPRRYGTIFVAVIVVGSLMALSLIVRLVIEKSFWRN